MKRTFMMILVLVFLIGKTASAQEVEIGSGTLTFNGKIAGGIFHDADDAVKENETGAAINAEYSGADGRLYMWNESDAKNSLRAELSAKYTNNNVGFRIRFRADDAFRTKSPVISRYAYGWIDLFDETLKFTGGFIDLSDNVWGTLGDGDWDIGGAGVRMEIKPFSLKSLGGLNLGELNIGAFFMVPADPNTNKIHDENGKEIPGDVTFERALGETVLGFRWTHPWFYAGAQVQLDTDVDGEEIQDPSGKNVWSVAGDEMRFMFGAGFTLLPELLITAEGNFEGLGNWEARGTGDLRQTLQYNFSRIPVPVIDRFTLGIKAKELLWGYDLIKLTGWDITLKPWVQLKPFVNFKVTGEFTAGLELGFGSGHLVLDHPKKSQKFVYEDFNFYIKPNLTYKLKNGLELKAWYMFNRIAYGNLSDRSIFADRKSSYIPKEADNTTLVESLVKQQIALEFVWSF